MALALQNLVFRIYSWTRAAVDDVSRRVMIGLVETKE
jgi:hypothetical protein